MKKVTYTLTVCTRDDRDLDQLTKGLREDLEAAETLNEEESGFDLVGTSMTQDGHPDVNWGSGTEDEDTDKWHEHVDAVLGATHKKETEK